MADTPLRLRLTTFVVKALVLVGLGLHPALGRAQVVTAITSTPGAGNLGTQVNQVGSVHNITGGTPRGANLFHSFGLFSVGAGDIANFNNIEARAITNILGRVTGGQTSNVFGTIQTTNFGSANLFLVNPAGWIFGPGASLDVGGSFHVSTADYVRFPDVGGAQVRFTADTSPLPAIGLSVDPIAFGFLSSNPTRISVEGSSLQVLAGQTLSLVGGAAAFPGQTETGLKIAGPVPAGQPSTLGAPSGQIRVVSVASASVGSPREVPLTGDLNLGSSAGLGQINISNGALLTVSSTAAGSVLIRGGQLFIDGQNTAILADTSSANAAATAVDIEANSVSLSGGALIRTRSSGIGRGGDVRLAVTESVDISGDSLNNPSRIVSEAQSNGDGGQVIITSASPAPSVSLSNHGRISSTTFFGTGRGGDIVMEVKDLSITGGGEIISAANGEFGRGGDVKVTATGSVTLSDEGSRIFSRSFQNVAAGGGAGDISLDISENLTLKDSAQIQSGDVTLQGANITVKAGDSVLISGESGISSQAFSKDVGQVAITTPSLMIDDGFIRASTSGAGNAGTILVEAGTVTLSHDAQIASSSEFSATTGRGGDVRVNATGPIFISGTGSGLFSTAEGIGDAGTIVVTTPTLTMNNGGTISVATSGAGNAGNISLNVGNLTQTGGARVDSSTISAGQGGNVTVSATDSVSISDQGSGLFSTASGTGAGGNVTVQAANLKLVNGALISANSTGTASATAGNINVIVSDTLRMENGSITTEALVADGGNISVTSTGSLLHLTSSQITTSVQSGSGGGGNITIGSDLHPFDFIVLNNSGIHANAFGGPGGNINIFADTFLSSLPITTAVTASSALSNPGVIDIQATIVDVSGDVSQLPEAPLQATELLRASCAARIAGGKSSSLVLAGRGGLPLEPGGLLPSPVYSSQGATAARDQGPSRLSILGQNERDFRLPRVVNPYGLPSANLRCSS